MNSDYYIILLYIPYYIYRKNKSKRKEKRKGSVRQEKRKEHRKGCRRHPRQFLARSSPLFRSVCLSSPSAPSPAAHPSPNRTQKQARRGRHLARFWLMLSPQPRHRLANKTTEGAAPRGCLSSCRLSLVSFSSLSRPSVPLFVLISSARSCPSSCRSSPPSGGEAGQRANQGGRSPAAHPADPLPPAG